MKSTIKLSILTTALAAMLLGGACSSTSYLTSSSRFNDDMYAVHDVEALAREEQRQAEIQRAAYAARTEQLNQMIAAAQSDSEIDNLLKLDGEEEYVNPYDDIMVDDYESAYERRLRGFSSPTYRMPSSYYDFRYGSDYFYATAYDPSFYNVMVMGDQVWVEPKYITSMFGSWGLPSVNFSFNFGWPYYNGFYSNYYWDRYYWDWYSPYSYWGWNSPYYDPYWGGWYGPHYGYGPGPGIHHGGFGNSNTVYRPSYGFNRRDNYSTGTRGVATGRPSSSSSSSGTVSSSRRTTESYRRSGDSNNSSTRTTRTYDSNSTRSNNESIRSNTTRTYDNNSTRNNNNSTTRNYDNNSTRNSNSNSSMSTPSRGYSSGSTGGGFSSGGGATRSGGGTSHSSGGRR